MNRKNGLGTLYFGRCRGIQVKVREIAVQGEISSMIYTKLVSEVKRWLQQQYSRSLENPFAVFTENKLTYIVMEGHPDWRTLREIVKENTMSMAHRIDILKNLAKIMNYCVHMKEPLSHGHLHPGNVLVCVRDLRVKVCDLGLTFLKKYVGMVSAGSGAEYTNKGNYTAPEYLSAKGPVVDKPAESGDVYSFGLIALTVVSGKDCFEGMDTDEVHRMIKEQKRPTIPEDTNPKIEQLIKLCWAPVPEERPRFMKVIELLEYVTPTD